MEKGTQTDIKNEFLRKIFGPKTYVGGNRYLENTKYFRVIKYRSLGLAGHVTHIRTRRGICKVLVGKTGGKRKIVRPRRRWEYKSKMAI
jgi:hypothetical protein